MIRNYTSSRYSLVNYSRTILFSIVKIFILTSLSLLSTNFCNEYEIGGQLELSILPAIVYDTSKLFPTFFHLLKWFVGSLSRRTFKVACCAGKFMFPFQYLLLCVSLLRQELDILPAVFCDTSEVFPPLFLSARCNEIGWKSSRRTFKMVCCVGYVPVFSNVRASSHGCRNYYMSQSELANSKFFI